VAGRFGCLKGARSSQWREQQQHLGGHLVVKRVAMVYSLNEGLEFLPFREITVHRTIVERVYTLFFCRCAQILSKKLFFFGTGALGALPRWSIATTQDMAVRT
jgi:hypothetical protein